jgi:MoaA/NifB/PqqE/SkfB family radical SAM enzyme
VRYGPGDVVPKFPSTVTFEITSRCNLACVMCVHGSPIGMLHKRDAPRPMIATILARLDYMDEVHPTGIGEPLMAEGFWEIVDALASRATPLLTFNTNGILLTANNVARLAKCSLGRVNVSIDAASELTYRRIRGADMHKTISGLDRLVAAVKGMAQADRIRIAISMVLMRENIEEASDFVRMAHRHGVRAVYFEHMAEGFDSLGAWTIKKDNFVFNYEEQRLYHDPAYSDFHILKALDVADELGVVVESPQLILQPDNEHHKSRPCMTGAVAGIFDRVAV